MKKTLKILLTLFLVCFAYDVSSKEIYVSEASSECEGNRYFGYEPGWYTVDADGNVINGGGGNGGNDGALPGGVAGGICSSGNIYENDCLFDCAVGEPEYLVGQLNDYCKTYCTESDSFTYPGFIPEVEQGTKFTWTIGGSSKTLDSRLNAPVIKMTMNKHCVVAFEYENWNGAYRSAQAIVQTFNDTVNRCGLEYNAGVHTQPAVCNMGTYDSGLGMCVLYGADGSIVTVYGRPVREPSTSYSCGCGTDYYTRSGNKCRLSDAKKAEAEAAVQQVNKLSQDAIGCSTYGGAQSINACGTATIKYGDEKYGATIALKQVSSESTAGDVTNTSSNSTLPVNRRTFNTYTYSKVGNTYVVSGTRSLSFDQYRYRSYSATTAWALPDYVYRYVLINGVSIFNFNESQDFSNAGGVDDYYGRYQNYIDIGFPNFPVGFNSAVGTHDLNISFEFCDSSLFKGKTINGACQYEVTNCEDGQCDPDDGGYSSSGFDVIYRVIDLNNPFPGADGDERLPGLNWSIDNTYVDRYITHNRGVITEEVYTKEPMYTITLTPSLIRDIRNYNKDNELNDFKLVCVNGENCRSIYLRELIENGHVSGCGAEDNFDACSRIDGR